MRAAVTSERKSAANRCNARASTGPKTAAGKARVACNARRHGLTVPIAADPALAREVEVLAQAICRSFARTATSPSPLVGEGRGGGSCDGARLCQNLPTPTPDPSPQGGGEKKDLNCCASRWRPSGPTAA